MTLRLLRHFAKAGSIFLEDFRPLKLTCLQSVLCLLFALFMISTGSSRAEDRSPNIVFIMCDDLGYSDVGCFGQTKIRTPNIDRLAAEGMKFTQHYSGNAVCATSRCVLMTGKHPGHAQIRDNREIKPEGQFPLLKDTATIARVLKSNGYVTGAFGKWGLGGPGTTGEPLQQGFDRFFGYNCQRVAHNYYPTHLWDDDKKIELKNPNFSAHQKFPADADMKNPANYEKYSGKDYAPDLIMEQARQFIKLNKDKRFFAYIPTTVPHLALQVPPDSLAEYLGKFPETPYDGSRGYLPHFAPRAAYAAMITRMDMEVGRILELLRELKLEDNTLVVFTSDNGPLYNQLGGTDTDFFKSSADLRGLKGSLYEGGFRVPMIARFPKRIAAGTTTERVTGFEDWMPTILDMLNLPTAIPNDVDGVSFAKTLLGQSQPEREFLYREFPGYGGQQLLHAGRYIAIRQKLMATKANPNPKIKTELYDLKSDPSQKNDLASSSPEIIGKLEKVMKEQHTPSAEFPMKVID